MIRAARTLDIQGDAMPCIIRGHEHETVKVDTKTRPGLDGGPRETLDIWECPTGNYRFVSVNGRPISKYLVMRKPRWGWKK